MSVKDIETFDEYVDAAWLLMCVIRSTSNNLEELNSGQPMKPPQPNIPEENGNDPDCQSHPEGERQQPIGIYPPHSPLAVEPGIPDGEVVQLFPVTQTKRTVLPLQKVSTSS